MKNLAISALVIVGLSAIHAARPTSEKVLQEIEKVRPRYKEIQDFVIHKISDARFKSSSELAKFHENVLMIKETFVLDAIQKEDALLFQIANQPASVDKNCLMFVATLADSFINLAGTGFSACITETSESLETAIFAFYDMLQQDEKDYVGIGLLNLFKDDNIFYTPESLLYKLQQKSGSLEGYPTYLQDDLLKTVNNLSSNLESLEIGYIGCMTNSERLLKDGFTMAQSHMNLTCRAETVQVAANAKNEISVPVALPNIEAVRRFRERFGLQA